ncbi:MAG: hypothetical protein ACRD2P_19035 [Terriglobia bacterium]
MREEDFSEVEGFFFVAQRSYFNAAAFPILNFRFAILEKPQGQKTDSATTTAHCRTPNARAVSGIAALRHDTTKPEQIEAQ